MQTKENTDYSGLDELIYGEEMRNYNRHIVQTAIRYTGKVKKCVDFGAGIGTLSLIFREHFGINPLCIEIDTENIDYLKKRNLDFVSSLEEINDDIDLIFSSNVLEHIEDDVETLKQMKAKLQPNGYLYLYLPANMILWSALDTDVGHYRRYTISECKQKLPKAGFVIKKLHYADFLGFLASLSMKLFGYNPESGIGSSASLRFYDKYLFPISNLLDNLGFRYLLGKNIVVVAQKT